MKQKGVRVTELLLCFSFQHLDPNVSQAQKPRVSMMMALLQYMWDTNSPWTLESCRVELMGRDKRDRDGSAWSFVKSFLGVFCPVPEEAAPCLGLYQ